MQRDFYTEQKAYRIYILITRPEDGPWCYVGKTTGGRISAIYSRHVSQKVCATRDYFSKDERPDLYIVEDAQMTGNEAYKHVLAWIARLDVYGYACINHEATTEQARCLLPDTQKILERISCEPLEDVLKRTYIERPADADRRSAPQKDIPESTMPPEKTQLCMRVHKADKERLDAFCKVRKLNRTQGLRLLLDQLKDDDASCPDGVLHDLQIKIDALKAENQKLRQRLDQATENQPSKGELWKSAYIHFLIEGIEEYLRLCWPGLRKGRMLPEYAYKKFMRLVPVLDPYRYPDKEGFFVGKIEAVLWGNPPCKGCFLVGKSIGGVRFRLRYYAKDHFAGVFPGETGHEWWLLGACPAADGAMDMVFALPMDAQCEIVDQRNQKAPQKQRSLAERLAEIDARKQSR